MPPSPLGKTSDLEAGAVVRQTFGTDTVNVMIFDHSCEPRVVQAASGYIRSRTEYVDAPPDVMDICLTPGTSPDDCDPTGRKLSKNHASIHGTYLADDGRSVRVDLDVIKNGETFQATAVKANPVRAAFHVHIEDFPPFMDGYIPDIDLKLIMDNPEPDNKVRYDNLWTLGMASGSVVVDGVDVLAGATHLGSVFYDVSTGWHGPRADPTLPAPTLP